MSKTTARQLTRIKDKYPLEKIFLIEWKETGYYFKDDLVYVKFDRSLMGRVSGKYQVFFTPDHKRLGDEYFHVNHYENILVIDGDEYMPPDNIVHDALLLGRLTQVSFRKETRISDLLYVVK